MLTLEQMPEQTRKQMEAAATPENVARLIELVDRAFLLLVAAGVAQADRWGWCADAEILTNELCPIEGQTITADGDGSLATQGLYEEARGM
jgi:hypothetical protein